MHFDLAELLWWCSVASLCLYSAFFAACALQLRRGRRFDAKLEDELPAGEWPGVSVLKPCAGADDELEACLESFFAVRYPRTQLLFGVRSTSDPAYAVIQRVRERHRAANSAVIITGDGAHVSPKISQMAALSQHAQHELWWLSDSNTKVHPDTLWDMVAKIKEPHSALVASPIVGDGEQTASAALENLHLNAYVVATTYALKLSMDRVAVPGKSMLVTREKLLEAGGWQAIGEYFADDEMLVQALMRRGYRLHLGTFAVQNVNAHTDWKKFYQRHLRWSQIRWRVVPHAVVAEFFLSPLILAALAWIAAPSRAHAQLLACALALQVFGDGALHGMVRGRMMAPKHLWTIVVRPFVVAALWVRGAFSGRVDWRGRDLWMGARARILTKPPARWTLRALRSARRG